MVLQHIARAVLPRRSFLKELVGLIAAPAMVRAEAWMPIAVWKPTFVLHGGNQYLPLLVRCVKDDLIGGNLDLPPPIINKANWGPDTTNGPDYYWRHDRFPLANLPLDKVQLQPQLLRARELSGVG